MENNMNDNLMALDRDVELLEESYDVLKRPIDGIAPNMRNVKLFIRKRAEEFRNQIKLSISILDRTLEFAEDRDAVQKLKTKLEKDLEAEIDTLSEIESMYESEVKCGLQACEKTWQSQHASRYEELKEILNTERPNLMNGQTVRPSTGNYSEKQMQPDVDNSTRLASLAQVEVQKSISFEPHHHQTGEESKDFPLYSSSHEATYVRSANGSDKHRRENLGADQHRDESENNLSPRCYNSNDCNDINQDSNSFNNLNMDGWQNNAHPTQRNLDSLRQNAQRSMQVVTADTELNRPKFGRKHIEFNNENFPSNPNCDEADNNLSPKCYDAQDCNDLDQASTTFNNLNLDGWQNNAHLSQRDRESVHQNAQRIMQVVTEETEANRPRFGRKNTAWMD